jgi:hypothetical protein
MTKNHMDKKSYITKTERRMAVPPRSVLPSGTARREYSSSERETATILPKRNLPIRKTSSERETTTTILPKRNLPIRKTSSERETTTILPKRNLPIRKTSLERETTTVLPKRNLSIRKTLKKNIISTMPKDILIKIFNYTGEYDEDIDGDIEYPGRRDIYQLYCTCKNFIWLSKLWITSSEGYGEYDVWHYTINIFGKHIGPQYSFYPYYEDSPSEGLSGYRYVVQINNVPKTGLTSEALVGNHIYTRMLASNLGILIVNGEIYDMDDKLSGLMAEQILNQWKLSDTHLYKWSMIDKWNARNIYVRFSTKTYPEYFINIPEGLKLDLQRSNYTQRVTLGRALCA